MEKNKRLYSIREEVFNWRAAPIIAGDCIWKGRPPEVSHYKAFCGIRYILTGCPCRDLSMIYDWFSGGTRGDYGRRRSGVWITAAWARSSSSIDMAGR
jgi:hypothetical protein